MSTATTTKMPQIQTTSSPNSLTPTSTRTTTPNHTPDNTPSPGPSSSSLSSQIHRPIPRRNTPVQVTDGLEDVVKSTQKPDTTPPLQSKLESPSTLALPSLTLSAIEKARPCKRTSSSSNDQVYERDRFRARLKSFNDCQKLDKQDDSSCEVCDGISLKTTKLNIETNPLDTSSMFYKQLPNYPSVTNVPIKSLTIDQLNRIFDWYFNSGLPNTKEMFPWLHGLHKFNFAQKSFFLHQQQQLQRRLGETVTTNLSDPMNNEIFIDYNLSRPNDIRFLMCVGDGNSPMGLHNTVQITEILTKIDVSKSEIKDIIRKIWSADDDGAVTDDTLVDLLVSDCLKLNVLPIFLNLDPERGISLRNFQIQVAKLSTCSDFVIYGTNQDKLESIARIIWLAQRYEHQQRKLEMQELGVDEENANLPTYSIFILKDDLSKYYEVLESPISTNPLKAFANISRIDTTPLNFKSNNQYLLNDYNLPLYEKIETIRMSSATKIFQNVWVGNFWDHQIMLSNIIDKIQVEADREDLRDNYCSPGNSVVLKEEPILELLPQPKATWKLFVRCHGEATFPDLDDLAHLLFKYTISSHDASDDFHHLEFPPLGSIGIGDCKGENLQLIINTCKLIYLYSSLNAISGLSSLIYCTDGYTELSLLIFCYLMYALDIPLDEAMLALHVTYGRPFYIFNSDVIILRKLEPLLRKFSPKVKQEVDWASLETLTTQEINELLLGTPRKISNSVKLGFIHNSEDEDEVTASDNSTSSSDYGDESIAFPQVDWVEEVEGSIPSKILPHLYLGSLKHALCLPLLNKLGIKKIISVGETLPWLNGYKFQRHNKIGVEQSVDGNIETYHISPNDPSRKHPRTTTIDTVMKVNNLEDDGIDELSQRLPEILKFINDEYAKSNGETKILVHCRVGVSRSATVVIAEVMKRLNINLPMAYIYVRVRRLNIIIQPNLRFMYELFKWEEQEKLKNGKNLSTNAFKDKTIYLREIDWFIMCREITKLNTPYLNNI
ncbi:Dual specificity protein phosphatase PPS1 [Candida viswanathii]|uniref:Dual specificity protein phosphatase PPS1 n=1 Tax=Candida viswanathii TaxID=5486 RepID=A0A367YI10_9ASCO|nr:Dual specificity protein phosphatase PPS1 [Candida viswanathii]